MKMLRALLALFAALVAVQPAQAWWDYGHRSVAAVAWDQAKPATRDAISRLLRQQRLLETPSCPARTIEEASVWPDCVKGLKDRFSYAYNWHFVDHDVCKPYDPKDACPDGNCATRQIERMARLLKDRRVPARERVMALAFLVHFVGDIHQPLHAAELHGDQGGNKEKARYGVIAGRANLHSVWDGLLADRAISTPPAGARGLLAAIPPAGRAAIAAGTPEDWVRENWTVAKDTLYPAVIEGDICAAPAGLRVSFDEPVIQRLVPVLRERVARGGIRLARMLDEAMSPPGG